MRVALILSSYRDSNLGSTLLGTPPRLAANSIAYDKLLKQHGDEDPAPFSLLNETVTNAVSVVGQVTQTAPTGKLTVL